MDFSLASLFSGLVVGSLGLFLFLYGKNAQRPILLAIGLLMCIYPYFISNLLIVWFLTALLLLPAWALRNA